MNKLRIVIFIFILVLLGVFSVSINSGNFFFTTKYYKTPIEAYNANCTSDVTADSEIGIVNLDNKNCLFIGEMDENRFVVSEMEINDGKYADKGTTVFYDLREESDGIIGRHKTNITDGYIQWSVVYSQSEVEKLSDVLSVESYTISSGHIIYFVIYDN